MTTGQFLVKRYRIIQFIGSGAFGTTYLAVDTRRPGNPTCVVKQLLPNPKVGKNLKNAQNRFRREAHTLEKLGKHPKIPQLFAYFEENKQFYLVEEYIPGYPLSSELTLGWKFTEKKTISLIQELLQILSFVHSNGVIHRDIKPANIIRRQSDSQLVLIDFGAVKEINEAAPSSQARTMATGTPAYMPLEQFQGNPKPNSDIYAVGMIAIQALTGVHPRELPVIKNMDHADSDFVHWQKWAKIRPSLANIIDKMILDDYNLRYQCTIEVLADLKKISRKTTPAQIPMTIVESDLETDDSTLQEDNGFSSESIPLSSSDGSIQEPEIQNKFFNDMMSAMQKKKALSGQVILFGTATLIAIGLWVSWETQINLKAKKLYNQAMEKVQNGQTEAAISDLNQAIKLVPSYEPAYYSRGRARFRLGDYSGSIADYSRAIKFNAQDAGAYANRCASYRHLSQFSEAIADCSQAIELNPNYTDAYINRCLAWIGKGEEVQALPDCDRALELDSNRHDAYYGRGLIHAGQGDPSSAIADYTSAIARNPEFAAAYYYRGLARVDLNDKKTAMTDFQKAAELCNSSAIDCDIDPNIQLQQLQ